MASNILVFNEIYFGRIREMNKYLWGTETFQTLYKHYIKYNIWLEVLFPDLFSQTSCQALLEEVGSEYFQLFLNLTG